MTFIPLPQVNPAAYPELFAQKTSQLEALFQQELTQPLPKLEAFASPASHYRYRAEFRIWHEGDSASYIMFEPSIEKGVRPRRVALTSYPVASKLINKLMPVLLEKVIASSELKPRLYQVNFLTSLKGESLITLIYHRKLDAAWQAAAEELSQQLTQTVKAAYPVKIMGRSRGQKLVLSDDFIMEEFCLDPAKPEQTLVYKQLEGSFTQPNPYVCQSMLNWAKAATQPITGEAKQDLLELYCGNGNFTLALAENFNRVLGTEVSRTSVAAGQFNIAANAINNVAIERLSAEGFALAQASLIANQPNEAAVTLNLAAYNFSTVLVDPPRAGLDAATLKQVQGFERIVYISCNPETLLDDLKQLTTSHKIEKLAFFDQFPYTDHAEMGLLLVKKPL